MLTTRTTLRRWMAGLALWTIAIAAPGCAPAADASAEAGDRVTLVDGQPQVPKRFGATCESDPECAAGLFCDHGNNSPPFCNCPNGAPSLDCTVPVPDGTLYGSVAIGTTKVQSNPAKSASVTLIRLDDQVPANADGVPTYSQTVIAYAITDGYGKFGITSPGQGLYLVKAVSSSRNVSGSVGPIDLEELSHGVTVLLN